MGNLILEDILNAPPVEDIVPEPQLNTPEPTEPIEPIEPPAQAEPVPVEPTPPVEPAVAEPDEEPMFHLPGQRQEEIDENEWLRRNYAASLNQIAALQNQVNEFQLAGLDDEEKAQEQLRLRQQQLEAQLQQFQQQQAYSEWQRYYSQFVDDPQVLANQPDVVQMGHTVLTSLRKRLGQVTKELEALKTAKQNPSAPAPQVVNGGGGAAPQRSLNELIYDEREYERLFNKAQKGLLQAEDIPPLT